jgi:hypothetical protein
LINQTIALRSHALNELYEVFKKETDTQSIVQVAAWALGEFQESPLDIPDLIAKLLEMPQTATDTRCYLLTALSKLAVRFKMIEFAKPILEKFTRSNHLEVQQRSGELLRVLLDGTLADQILAPVDEDEKNASASSSSEAILIELDSAPPKHPDKVNPVAKPPTTPIAIPPGAVEALSTPDYVIYFEIQRNAQNPRQIAIRSSTFGLGAIPLTKFSIQYGVPQGWGVIARPPSGNVLEPRGGQPIQQVMMLENRGPHALAMMTQVSYMYRTQPIKETGRINPIFD